MRFQLPPIGMARLFLELWSEPRLAAPCILATAVRAPALVSLLTLESAIRCSFKRNLGLSEGQQHNGRATTAQIHQEIKLFGKQDAHIASAERRGEVAVSDVNYRTNFQLTIQLKNNLCKLVLVKHSLVLRIPQICMSPAPTHFLTIAASREDRYACARG
jgi:hypothetical protein